MQAHEPTGYRPEAYQRSTVKVRFHLDQAAYHWPTSPNVRISVSSDQLAENLGNLGRFAPLKDQNGYLL
jgi:hypothetical protein